MKLFKYFLITLPIFLLSSYLYAAVSLTSSVVNNVCYNGTAGSITGTASGGGGQYEYSIGTGFASGWQASNLFSSLSAGTYPVSVRDKNNINDIATIYVTVGQPTNISVSSSVTNTSCSASSDGVVALTVSGGTSPYSYTWTKNGSPISGATASSITGLAPGVYNAIVTDANGCQQQLTNASSTAIVPLSLTGFNQDVIANGTNTSTSTNTTVTSPFDKVTTTPIAFPGSDFYANGFKSSSAASAFSTNGLPANGSLTSAANSTHQFVLANYSASNTLRLNGTSSSGTLTIAGASVAPYQNLYLLSSSANGTTAVNYSVKYSDNTTSTGSFSITDWASGSSANVALGSLGRVYYNEKSTGSGDAGTLDPAGNIFAIYDLPINLSANTKNISSITFTNTSLGQANIFAITGSTSSTGVTVSAGATSSVTPTVAISPNPSNLTYCSGENFTFTATPTNAGSSPTYAWTVAGANQSSTSSTMSAAITGTGSKNVTVTLTVTDPTATCLTSQTATQTITLNSGSVTPTVSVNGPSSVCQGTSTTYIATPVNGGTNPTYAWYVNGSLVSGATSPTFTNTLSNTGANSIYAKVTSSTSCATPNPATSNTVSTTVNPTVTPSVTIVGTKSGSNVILSISTSANLGSSPSYQWYLNGNPIPSATSATYTASNPLSSDLYSLAVTSSATCPSNTQVMSNYVNANTMLPVTLAWFKATLPNSNNALLSWQTASEINVKMFEIQRSQGSTGSFVTVGFVAALNSSIGSTYSFTDPLSVNGNYFYRLKSVDLDASYAYSDIVSIAFNKGASTSIMVYPNPFSDELRIQIATSQTVQNAGFTLYNIAGQVIYTTVKNISAGSQTIVLQDLNKLPSGIYMLKLNGAGIDNSGIKIIKKK